MAKDLKSKETKSEALDPLDAFLCFAVYSTGHAFNRFYKPRLDALGLTYPQYLVMVLLSAEDDQTVGDICEKLFLESNTLTPLIKRLEASGYVTRRRDAEDERIVRVSLTAQGKRIAKKAACVPAQTLEALDLPAGDLAELRRVLITVREKLQAADRS
ncbi:MarR family transcriptional regulator [Methyloligella sp. 2.7D]|uniref:MarR family winged helix-turn-helix transcriptional regulator n=1 Tax=unclassified Methyloligella TaxID=2625955 RepID=UPI00157D236A|nr:MarR family transcriptional regulator [Methyloligella sp. GL2]QKP76862.1 MarR family transcriptional regulator [Methyloligella sp. GL2]